MGCSSDWITLNSSEAIQNTEVSPYAIVNNCTWVYLNTTAPWGTKATASLAIGESVKKINPYNSLEYIIIKCLDLWCPAPDYLAAKIEVCHEMPIECPIPICSFIIS